MSPKNLNATNKTHKFLLNKLKDKRISKIYERFEKNLNLNQNFIVAVSGGTDSLALSFLAKVYSIKKSLIAKYFIVDHKLRNNSSSEAIFVKNLLKQYSIKLNILKWNGTKPKNNIQSIARKKRYKLLINAAKKFKIQTILTGHQLSDQYENFFIRIVRGSGLNGLISLDEKTFYQEINLIRPLINFEKKDLTYIVSKVFDSYVDDPSNQDDSYTRVRIRKLIKNLQLEGLDNNKFFLTIKNLKLSNETIKYYVEKNLNENSFYSKNKSVIILKKEFFNQPHEIVFRSLMQVIKFIGKKYYTVRGRKLDSVIESIKLINNSSFKITLGNCIIKKVNNSILVSKEQ